MKRIIVIGCPGAGKSYFSKKLSSITGIPLYHLDLIWHKPDKTTVSRVEFDNKLSLILTFDEWIIDGNYSRTLETRIAACDSVFLFDLPTEDCLFGIEERIGKTRSDMPWTETETDPDFKKFVCEFSEKNQPRIYGLLDKYHDNKNVTVFKSRSEADRYIENLILQNTNFS